MFELLLWWLFFAFIIAIVIIAAASSEEGRCRCGQAGSRKGTPAADATIGELVPIVGCQDAAS